MKKRTLFIVVPIVLISIVGGCFFVYPVVVHHNIIHDSHNYQPQSLPSFDETYVLQTQKLEEDAGVYVSFAVIVGNTQKKIF